MKYNHYVKKYHDKYLFRTYVRLMHSYKHLGFFLKWFFLAIIVGIICGLIGTAFHYCLDIATETFGHYGNILYLLPVAGLIIVFAYRKSGILNDEGTNSILRAARAESTAALRITPLIFLASFLTHICGGSAGREGAALQIGGSIGSFVGRKIHLDKYDHQLMVMCGMSATFCALFGTPMTAAMFSIEVSGVGTVFYAGLVPCIVASVTARLISRGFGVEPLMARAIAKAQDVNIELILKVLVLAVLVAILSIIFCSLMHNSSRLYKKYLPNPYIRIVVGACLVILLTLIFGTRDYNTIGMHVIQSALAGSCRPEAFALKMILTAVTLGAGFKGGEIVPTLFIGSTFGCTMGLLLGIDPVFAAEIAMIGFFCGVVNCPISSVFLSVEIFGSANFLLFGITCAISYLLSGYYSLYSGQKFMNSKTMPVLHERSAK